MSTPAAGSTDEAGGPSTKRDEGPSVASVRMATAIVRQALEGALDDKDWRRFGELLHEDGSASEVERRLGRRLLALAGSGDQEELRRAVLRIGLDRLAREASVQALPVPAPRCGICSGPAAFIVGWTYLDGDFGRDADWRPRCVNCTTQFGGDHIVPISPTG